MSEKDFQELVPVRLPKGTTMTLLNGIVYEADVYGIIRVSKGVAEKLIKDSRFEVVSNPASRKVADPTASETQDSITAAVVEASAKAEQKAAEASPASAFASLNKK